MGCLDFLYAKSDKFVLILLWCLSLVMKIRVKNKN